MAALLLLAACGPEEATVRPNPANRKPDYFDVKGLLDGQVARLNQQQPVVEKQVQLRNGTTDTTRVTKTDWSKELQIFYQADINKPALRGAYSKSVSASYNTPDGVSTYKLKPSTEAPVALLVIGNAAATATASPTQELAAVIRQDNPLFYSQKRLRLSILNGQLAEYSVQGVQKLVLFDTVRYSVRVKVVR
ncbi:hypothetical protein [Hymenobacter sediminicola]|uniref:Uncharacterized protein n=1 Tax=Hymenobacter sediminicola TaxID=2761579 RepID=A0A7G7W7P4_9BACT|nr:hypothetical protein [Hymenobacter sediminicola]QNH62387.1 hypothetical protein H4317_00730 [Hymenobacter sediminicola]